MTNIGLTASAVPIIRLVINRRGARSFCCGLTVGETAGPLEDGVVGGADFVEETHDVCLRSTLARTAELRNPRDQVPGLFIFLIRGRPFCEDLFSEANTAPDQQEIHDSQRQ